MGSIIFGENQYQYLLIVGGICSMIASFLSILLIAQHLIYYNKPSHQRYVIRILLIVPIYSIDSWISLYFKRDNYALFIDVFRDCYEAYVLYNFFKLLTICLGGIEAIQSLAMRKSGQLHYPFPFGWIIVNTEKLYIRCLRGVIQYTLVKPMMALIAVFIYAISGRYHEGNFSWDEAYLYTTIINNISVVVCLYYLILFYESFQIELTPHKPISRFLVIKGIIFFTFWQSVFISLIIYAGFIPESDTFTAHQIGFFLNDFLVCFEMVVAAITHYYAFSYVDYKMSTFSERERLDSEKEQQHVGCFDKFVQFRYNLHRYKPNIKDGIRDVNNNSDVVLDTIKSIKKSAKKSIDYHNFIDLSSPNDIGSSNDKQTYFKLEIDKQETPSSSLCSSVMSSPFIDESNQSIQKQENDGDIKLDTGAILF